jgi:hypothetical protein
MELNRRYFLFRLMRNLSIYAAGKKLLFGALLFLSVFISHSTKAAGVTIITHGLDGNATGWVTGMANEIHNYYRFPGTNYTFYEIYFNYNAAGNYYYPVPIRLAGNSPSTTDSGEIIIAFDWSQLADGNSYNTYQIANVLSAVLLETNFISELNGHALCELPIHLIGHSRGGSLMCQTSLLLGTNGIWIDHLTTLDPHPLNNDGFYLDSFLYSAVDAPCATYQNVLFHDNYWENIGLLVYGESVSGAYIRYLTSLSGGYENTSDEHWAHSNVHLWYHGSIDFDNPATDGDPLNPSITSTERNNWWASYEDYGIISGFYYSLIGGGDRTSYFPLGLPGDPMIRDGYNQLFGDIGAGASNNRTSLPSNSGTWPNIIKFDIMGTNTVNTVTAGSLIGTTLYYQYGGSSNLTVQIFYDQDFNPYNSNSVSIGSLHPPVTGTGSVSYYTNLTLTTTNVSPGNYTIYAKITDGLHTRYLYTPEVVTIISNLQSPTLDIKQSGNAQFIIGINGVSGQKIILQASSSLKNWTSLATNTLTASRWTYTNNLPANVQFYRAVLSQ